MASLNRPPDFEDWKALPSDAMLQEIGRIAIISAGIEDLIHGIIWKYLEVDDGIGAHITGRFKLGALQSETIKFLRAAKAPISVVEDLQSIFKEVERSAKIRNMCLHWIWNHPVGGDYGVHKLDPPTYQQNEQSVYYTVKQISEIADDMVWLETRLYPHSIPLDILYQEIKINGVEMLPTPWLCILPQPTRDSK